MKPLEPALERQLARAERRYKWLRFWRWLSALGFALSAALLVLGALAVRDLLRNPMWATLAVLALLLVASAGFVTIAAVAAASSRPRPWLASALERVWEPLLDRLNTLVFLEGRRHDPEVAPYFRRIERQARSVLPMGALPSPFRARAALLQGLACLALVLGTVAFYVRYEPWQHLSWDADVHVTPKERLEVPALEPPKGGAAEVKGAPWGEVRITEPGRDLKVTKVDVVPLQVEAASDQALKKAAWFTAVGGGAASEHALPPPPEPNYAVYKPLVYVDEMGLSDWDLVSYYASASTASGARFASEVYFIEVRPFREDILKLPGGEGGKGYRGLNQLTGLIDRQRQVLRETHRYNQQTDQKPELRRQDRGKLVAAEADLRAATRHLYAELASEMENQAIGDVLTHLAQAEDWMGRARDALADEAPDAMAKEQGALAELVATRKSFQKAISEHPGAFGEDASGQGDENVPVAELPDKLKQILELRDEEKAAQDVVKKALEEQRRIAAACRSRGPGAYDGLAREQDKAAQPLRDLQSSQPRAFKGAEKEAARAAEALRAAGEALRQKAGDAPAAQEGAVESLERLEAAMERRRLARDLTHAYRLKDLLDKQAQQMGRMQAEPGKFSADGARRAGEDAKSTTRELKKAVEDKPVKDAFGPGLGEALSGPQQRDLESKLDALGQASSPQERGKAAGAAREGLERVSRAFEQSQPTAAKDLKADRLGAGDQEALERALQELESLVAQGEGGRRLSPDDEARQRRELLLNLRKGLKGTYGENEKSVRLLLRVEEALAKDLTPAEKARLRKLLDEIEQFRVQMADARMEKPGEGALTRVDPSRLPAAYRDRIQKYFRKLSEQ